MWGAYPELGADHLSRYSESSFQRMRPHQLKDLRRADRIEELLESN
jgi:hypothetical protein